MNIRRATEQDFDIVYQLWKENRKKLGPAWKTTIARQLAKGEFFLGFQDNIPIAMICFHYSKKYRRYEIQALVVKEGYRGKGYGRQITQHAVDTAEDSLIGEIPVYVAALDGDENNQFYDRFCTVEWYNEYKTVTTRVYRVNKRRLIEWAV